MDKIIKLNNDIVFWGTHGAFKFSNELEEDRKAIIKALNFKPELSESERISFDEVMNFRKNLLLILEQTVADIKKKINA